MSPSGPDLSLPPGLNGQAGLLLLALQQGADPTLLVERVAPDNLQQASWRAVFVNQALTRLVESEPGALQNVTLNELIARVSGNLAGTELAALLQRRQPFRLDVSLRAGEVRWVEAQVTPLTFGPGGALGGPSHWLVVLRDVTAERQALALATGRARALQLAVQGAPLLTLLRALIETLDDRLPGSAASATLLEGDQLHLIGSPYLLGDAADLRVAFERSWALTCSRAIRQGQPVLARYPAGFPAPLRPALVRAGYARSYSVPLREGGEVLGALTLYGRRPTAPHRAETELLEQFAALAALLIARDRTFRQLEDLAFRDPLTGLANRTRFIAALGDACAALDHRGRPFPFAVGLLDLDGFKLVNDAHGHLAGDHLLARLAARLVQTLPPEALVARMGGDEFALLLPGATARRVQATTRALYAVLEVPFLIGGASVRVGGSLGWSLAPREAQTPDDLLRRADAAMYATKRAPPP
ncbi:MAG: diguanylate cyclase [Deinococcota bacterium]